MMAMNHRKKEELSSQSQTRKADASTQETIRKALPTKRILHVKITTSPWIWLPQQGTSWQCSLRFFLCEHYPKYQIIIADSVYRSAEDYLARDVYSNIAYSRSKKDGHEHVYDRYYDSVIYPAKTLYCFTIN